MPTRRENYWAKAYAAREGRWYEANQRADLLAKENATLKEIIKAQSEENDFPLWKRIANQRLALAECNFWMHFWMHRNYELAGEVAKLREK